MSEDLVDDADGVGLTLYETTFTIGNKRRQGTTHVETSDHPPCLRSTPRTEATKRGLRATDASVLRYPHLKWTSSSFLFIWFFLI